MGWHLGVGTGAAPSPDGIARGKDGLDCFCKGKPTAFQSGQRLQGHNFAAFRSVRAAPALLVTVACVVGFGAGARAQSANSAILLEPVTVTARKFEEPIQQVPFATSAVSQKEMREAKIENTQDLYRWIPNFNFTDSGLPFSNLINIRGVGSSSALIAPSVNYYVDGVPIPARVLDQRFLDVSRIEVLRGPQGTLFGLNSQAGAVAITTGDPTRKFEGEVATEFGSFGRKQLTATLSGPVNETVAARFAGQLYDYTGDIRNYLFDASRNVVSSDSSVRAETYGALRGKVQVTPDAVSKITLAVNYQRDRQKPTTGVLIDDPAFPRNAYNPLPSSQIETTGSGLTYERDLGWARLTSITGANYYNIGLSADIIDGFIGNAQTNLPVYAFQTAGATVRTIGERNTQFSQETRLDGVTAGGIRWVSGVSALYADFTSTTDIVSPQLANGAYTGALKTTNVAAFGEVTIPIAERLRFIAGLRTTYELKDYTGLFRGRAGGAPARPLFTEAGDTDNTFVTGRSGLSYDLTPDLTTFATLARGEKTGGYLFYNQFASLGIPLQPFRNAGTWSYETGLRGKVLVPWIEASTSVFFNDTKDEQLFTYNPVAGRISVQNADTETYGAELELKARPTEHLIFAGNLAVLHAEITGSATSPALIGNAVPYAPQLTGGLSAEYRQPLRLADKDGAAFARVEYQYVGSRQIDPANSRELDDYSLVHLRSGWQGESMDVYGYVQNLFNETYVLSAFQSGTSVSGKPVFAGVPGTSRSFGLGARVRF